MDAKEWLFHVKLFVESRGRSKKIYFEFSFIFCSGIKFRFYVDRFIDLDLALSL